MPKNEKQASLLDSIRGLITRLINALNPSDDNADENNAAASLSQNAASLFGSDNAKAKSFTGAVKECIETYEEAAAMLITSPAA